MRILISHHFRLLSPAMLLAVFFPVLAQAGPLDAAVATPDWLTLSLHNQSRLSFLDGQLRKGRSGSDQIWENQLGLKAEVQAGATAMTLESLDARAWLADTGTPLSSAIVNPLDILQLNVSHTFVREAGNTFTLSAGRFTQDAGSRRLLARNRFRNTINAFDGIRAVWSDEDRQLLFILASPVLRRFAGSALDPGAKADRSFSNQKLWTLFWKAPVFKPQARLELFVFGLNEADSGDRLLADQDSLTAGARLFTAPAAGRWDTELEAIWQQGNRQAAVAGGNQPMVDVSAASLHAETGYTFTAAWQPRLQLAIDYASGDGDAADARNETFDSLFGIPRGEFGPTGIFRPFTRSNVSSYAIRLDLQPVPGLRLDAEWHDMRLANAADSWYAAGFLPSDNPGTRRVARQFDLRARWALQPGAVQLEFGLSALQAGALMRVNGKGDSLFSYLMLNLDF